MVKIAEKAWENAVQRTTRTKISQTWLASQTGPIERSIWVRIRSARSPDPGQQIPYARAEVRSAEDRVEGHPDPEDRRAGVGGAHADAPDRSPGGGPYGSSPSSALALRQRRERARSTTIAITPSAT